MEPGRFFPGTTAAYSVLYDHHRRTLVGGEEDRSKDNGGGAKDKGEQPFPPQPPGKPAEEDPALELVVTEEQRRDPPAGNELSAGKVNRPLLCGREKKPFHDGSGLCFQGRRRPEEREVSPFILLGKRWLQLKSEDEVRRDVFSLAKGGTREAPFGEEVVEKARKLWVKFLLERGMRSEEELWVREERQPFMLAALQQHLEVMKDPRLKGSGKEY